MTGKRSAAQLRQMAKDLIAQAKRIEEKELIELGKIVKKYLDNGFKNVDFETLKNQLKKVVGSGKD
ncbi:MAG: hypothetical protein LWX52_15165 [Deltaproteobacteria bacterium]|nr:hypothetical protein [Deltaproteobacteria bacterium]